MRKTEEAVARQIAAMGCHTFEIGLFKPDVPGKGPVMIPRTWDSETVLRSVAWLCKENLDGRNIFCRPRGEHALSLVDDLSAKAVSQMKDSGFEPALVVETSPHNFQAWLNHGRVLDPTLSTGVAKALAAKFDGDAGAADWRHFGRLAGFTNRKSKYFDQSTGHYPFVRIVEDGGRSYQHAEYFVNRVENEMANSCSSGCVSLGSSSNPVYVTLAPSIVSPKVSPIMLTYVALAVGGGGATTPQTSVNNTWTSFSNGSGPANVKTWDGRSMNYYSSGFNTCAFNAGQLVEQLYGGSGQCGAFAWLLESALAMNGIPSNWIQINATDRGSTGEKMVIKKWILGTPSYPTFSPWFYKIILNNGDYMYPARSSYGDLSNDMSGLPGQGTTPPVEKVFDFHFIVQVPSVATPQYYDPSYGVKFVGTTDFESGSVAGYAEGIGSDSGGLYHFRVPSGAVNITFTPVANNSIP